MNGHRSLLALVAVCLAALTACTSTASDPTTTAPGAASPTATTSPTASGHTAASIATALDGLAFDGMPATQIAPPPNGRFSMCPTGTPFSQSGSTFGWKHYGTYPNDFTVYTYVFQDAAAAKAAAAASFDEVGGCTKEQTVGSATIKPGDRGKGTFGTHQMIYVVVGVRDQLGLTFAKRYLTVVGNVVVFTSQRTATQAEAQNTVDDTVAVIKAISGDR